MALAMGVVYKANVADISLDQIVGPLLLEPMNKIETGDCAVTTFVARTN